MKKRLVRLIIAAVLLILGTGVFLFTRDEPPPDDADLRIPYLDIPDEENAFYYFNKAIGEIYVGEREERDRFRSVLDGETWDQAFVEEFLDKNGNWAEYVQEGLRCERFQVPEITNINTLLPYLPEWRQMARLSSVRALYLLKTGREEEAFDECVRTVRFGHRIQNSHGNMIVFAVGLAVQEIGLKRFRNLLAETTSSPEALTPYIRRLGEYASRADGLANAFRNEYVIYARTFDDLAAGKPTSVSDRPGLLREIKMRFVFKPNRTKRLLAEVMGLLIENTRKPYAEMRFPEPPDYLTKHSNARLYASGNGVGLILSWMMIPALCRFLEQKCRENCAIAATQILIALKCSKVRTGELPDSLDELVPEYFPEVPLDDFDGKPMKYSKEKRVVYAVGADLEDNGGVSKKELGDDADTDYDEVFKIDF